MNKKNNKKNGFTLIELLAVIIILGILMIIAIPSVTSYINNSRKSAYVDTAREIISGARSFVNEGKVPMYDTDVTYYVNYKCISTENGSKSPYGDFVDGETFVVVTYTGKGFNYYWVSRDETGQGVNTITSLENLDEDAIVSDIKAGDIKTNVPVGSRTKTQEVGANCQLVGTPTQADTANAVPEGGNSGGNGGSTTPTDVAVYPKGKTKAMVVVGDVVTIGDEEFYVISNDTTNDRLTLLAHYNLNVGSNAKGTATGLQDQDVKGWVSGETTYGTVAFSNTYYWNGKIGSVYPGTYCSSNGYRAGTNCAYVYDSNSNLKTYVDAYKTALEGMGARVLEARLMKVEEAYALGCGNGAWSCKDSPANAPSWVYDTSYWLGSAMLTDNLWRVISHGSFTYSNYSSNDLYGVRPVIVI